jgi:hypothetical protein
MNYQRNAPRLGAIKILAQAIVENGFVQIRINFAQCREQAGHQTMGVVSDREERTSCENFARDGRA